MVEPVKKKVAIGIAGVTAVVVAAWRQVQRDNAQPGKPTGKPSTAKAPTSPAGTEAGSARDVPAAPPAQALFTPTVNEKSTKAELYEMATELEINGRSKMNKGELLEAIRNAS